jgi:hypothetical protein
MPNYGGLYATPYGSASGLGNSGLIPASANNQWVLPPSTSDQNQGYYWDWTTNSYRKTNPTTGAYGTRYNVLPGSSGPSGAAGGGQVQSPAGVQVPFSNEVINPNNASQRYQAVSIAKAPDIISAQGSLMDSFKKGAADSMKGFDEWLKTFQASMTSAQKQSQAANDPTQTINELNARQARYDTATQQGMTDYAALNAQTAANEQGIVQQAQDLIPMYDKASQDAIAQQLGALQRGVSRYKAGSGTPMGAGTAEMQMLTKGAADILVPMKQAQIQQRYNVLGQFAMPVALDIANREQARIGTFNPAMVQQQFQSGQATAQTVNQLKVIASQMSRTDAVAFLQAMAVPPQIQQQILTGQIQQLGALGQIEDQSYYRGLQDKLGAYPTQSVGYNNYTGAYPNASRYTGAGGGGYPANRYQAQYPQQQVQAPNASSQVIPQNTQQSQNDANWVWDQGLGAYYNQVTGAIQEAQPGDPRYAPQMASNRGAQSNSYYDTNTGNTFDRYSNEWTG